MSHQGHGITMQMKEGLTPCEKLAEAEAKITKHNNAFADTITPRTLGIIPNTKGGL